MEQSILEVPRARLAGTFLVTEQPVERLPELDPRIDASHKEDGTEALAWYRSYHFGPSHAWGITILQQGVFYPAKWLQHYDQEYGYNQEDDQENDPSLAQPKFDSLDYLQLAFNALQVHEYFHFAADVACSLLELARIGALYRHYFEGIYQQRKFEEAIANAYAFRKMRNEGISEGLKDFMKKEPHPYSQFQQFTERRTFQRGRQKLMGLMCPNWPSSTGSPAGAELLVRIDHLDLDYQDAPLYLQGSTVAKAVPSPLRFIRSIPNLGSAAKFVSEYSQLPVKIQHKVTHTKEILSKDVMRSSLHFEKVKGHGPVFICRVDSNYVISLRYHGYDSWEILRVGRHRDVCSNPW